jgi:Cdc6-like AAA superfamily ATPase
VYKFLENDILEKSFVNRSDQYEKVSQIMEEYMRKKERKIEHFRDKTVNPIIAVVGNPGQGKTCFLNNSIFYKSIKEIINEKDKELLPVIIEFNKDHSFVSKYENDSDSVINIRIFHKLFNELFKRRI